MYAAHANKPKNPKAPYATSIEVIMDREFSTCYSSLRVVHVDRKKSSVVVADQVGVGKRNTAIVGAIIELENVSLLQEEHLN